MKTKFVINFINYKTIYMFCDFVKVLTSNAYKKSAFVFLIFLYEYKIH